MTWNRIPKYWRQWWLAKHFGSVGLDMETLTKIDQKNPEAVNQLFNFFVGIWDTLHLPRAALQKIVTDALCEIRAEALGRASEDFIAQLINSDYSLDWSKACYSIYSNSEDTLMLRHESGDEVLIHPTTTRGSEVTSNMWSPAFSNTQG